MTDATELLAATSVTSLNEHRLGTESDAKYESILTDNQSLLVVIDVLAPERDIQADKAAGDPKAAFADFNDRLLNRLGGSTIRPPGLEAGWETLDDVAVLDATARDVLDAVASSSNRVIAEGARLGLLVAYWRRVIESPLAAVLVVRDPICVATTLRERLGISTVHALGLYERYTRMIARGLDGVDTFVFDLDTARSAPWQEDLAQFLSDLDMSQLEPAAIERLEQSVAALVAVEDRENDLVLDPIRSLHDSVAKLHGRHNPLQTNLGDESPWTKSLLELAGDVDHLSDSLAWAVRQLEPLVRARPRTDSPLGSPTRRTEESDDRDEEIRDEDEDGPYPLNASEDRRAYHRWLRAKRLPVAVGSLNDPPLRKARTRAPLRRKEPLVSVLVPVWRVPMWALERCVGSVLGQTYADWELCLCDDASGDGELSSYLKSLHKLDRRIRVTSLEKNSGISAATNAALELARGRFVTFLDHDDELTPNALESVARAIEAAPDVDVLYSDEDKIDASGERFDPLFKPEWSPDLLLSFAYLCHLTVVRRELVVELDGLRAAFDGSQDYDLSLRATERARRIVHIPEVLYHWRSLPGSAAADSPGAIAKPWAYEAGRRAIDDALERRAEHGDVSDVEGFPGRYHVRRVITGEPLVSIIVPFRDEPALLATCATSLRRAPGYDRIELVLVDNGSELPETEALLEQLEQDPSVRVIRSPGPFNWAALNNEAVKVASGDMLLFANNDIEARKERWLDAMLGHAQRPEVGAVGARLLYPDGAIQHAGVVIGLGGIAGHVLRGLPGEHPGYNSMAIQTRNCSVVTGACMMTRREVFDAVGGFDERLPVAFNDVDYCLKLRDAGYLIVYTPLAELVHHESRSRGHTDDVAESLKIARRWGGVIAAGDPYTSVHVSHWRHWCPLSTAQEDDRWKTYLETSVLTLESS